MQGRYEREMTPGQGRVAREFRTNMCKSATCFRNCTSTLVDCASTCASPQHPQLSLSLHTRWKAAHRRHSSQGPLCFSSKKTAMYFLSLPMYVMTPSRPDLQCWTRSLTCILATQRKDLPDVPDGIVRTPRQDWLGKVVGKCNA